MVTNGAHYIALTAYLKDWLQNPSFPSQFVLSEGMQKVIKIVLKVLAISEPILPLTAVVQVHLQNVYCFWYELNTILYLENCYIHTRFDCNGSSTPEDEDFLRITNKLRERVGFLYDKRKKYFPRNW